MANRPSKDMEVSHRLFNEFCDGKPEIYSMGSMRDYIVNGGGEFPNKQTYNRWFREIHYLPVPGEKFVWRHNAGRHE